MGQIDPHAAILKGISKTFGGTQALNNVDIDVKKGEIHAVIGENGAGKSTLMKIIAGLIQPDSGHIFINGGRINFTHPSQSENAGVTIVHQEPAYFPDLTVLENIYMHNEFVSPMGRILWHKMAQAAHEPLTKMGLKPSILNKIMGYLPIGTQQMALIARAICRSSKLLILDEPTSCLSQNETMRLFSIVRELREEGVGILYISHRIEEIIELSDRVTVLRDGHKTECLPASKVDHKKLIFAMSGRDIDMQIYQKREISTSKEILDIKNLTCAGHFHDINFKIKEGEILGLYGLVGAGRTELAQAITGILKPTAGTLHYKNQPFKPKNIKTAFRAGISALVEDRKTQGLFFGRSVRDNMVVGLLEKLFSKFTIVNEKKELHCVRQNIERYSIKLNNIEDDIFSLSGGNQQKVLFVRSLMHDPDLLILDEPTRGIDVKTKTEIHKIIFQMALNKVAVIVISSEIAEVLAISDHILVLHEGHQMGIIDRTDADERTILQLALGIQ